MSVRLISSCAQSGRLCLTDKLRTVVSKSASNLSISSKNEEEDHKKIFYNSIIHKNGFMRPIYIEKRTRTLQRLANERKKPVSVALKYIMNEEVNSREVQVEEKKQADIVFPYSAGIVDTQVEENIDQEEADFDIVQDDTSPIPMSGRKWMNDYEKYSEETYEEDDNEINSVNYGTSDPNVPSSEVPCGGCGAYLHCKDPAIPGYLPSEIFKECHAKDLRSLSCQRCHFLQNYNTALSVSVDPESYPKLLSKIKYERALVILMVDLTDFPCSIYPGILDIIGRKRPIFIVGNKVDLLWGDSRGWTNNVLKSLQFSFPKDSNIKYISLISAKTGFGVEKLINKLHNVWGYQGDVYLIGCTNVGKSTLFNALLQSDYCKVKAVDILQRATTSPWPGTTLNLLKFPILRPAGWRLYVRTQRLIAESAIRREEESLKKEQMAALKIRPTEPVQLIEHIGRTFQSSHDDEEETPDSFSLANRKDIRNTGFPGMGLDPNDKDFEHSKWLYDTPGVLHKDQVLDLLTTEEIMKTVTKKIIEPRSFILKPETTLFIGGIARLDYIEGNESVWFTVFSSNDLPVTICNSENANEVYKEMVGTESMGVPIGMPGRMEKWPGLKPSERAAKVLGINAFTSCVDFVLSSCGWIAVTVKKNQIATFLPWTPEARGIHIRIPSLLPHAVDLKGPKIKKLPAYEPSKPFYEYTR